MDNIERRDSGMPYISDRDVFEEQKRTRRILHELNTCDPSDFEKIGETAKKLLRTSNDVFINPPFYCDYGFHIRVGKNFSANYNCVILDVGEVTIGDNVMFAPNVAVYTAGHPIHPAARSTGYEYGIPISIGDNVWVGGNVVILPGVRVGSNTVIGAGSVVTRDVPDWTVAAGNPCRVIREITEEDRQYYFRDRRFDPESMAAVMAAAL